MTKFNCLLRVFGLLCAVTALCLVYFERTGFINVLKIANPGTHCTGVFEGVWPKSDNDNDDRLMSQLRFMKTYRPRIFDAGPKSGLNGGSGSDKRKGKMKFIHCIGKERFEDCKEGQRVFLDNKCPVNTCWITMKKSAIPTADALLISVLGKGAVSKYLPKPPNQIWIANHYEPPHRGVIDTNSLKDLINWTSTYRRSSTIYRAYARWERKKTKNSSPPSIVQSFNYATGKTKKISMLVSNCFAPNNRMEYTRELQKYISVDIYGGCAEQNYSKGVPSKINDGLSTINVGKNGVKWLTKHYKFYLAFENTICKDYITEKLLLNALGNNILPIVYGTSREDYAAVTPPHSYIHVDDFRSPQHLAQYLDQLDKNDTLYNEYFAWKSNYYLLDQGYWCRMCMLLHLQEEVRYIHWYHDYDKWWNPGCLSDWRRKQMEARRSQQKAVK